MRGKTHCLEVWGDLACFTRPEMKVERYSYPVITPSAARGIFDAIYWKKSYEFYWQIERIEVLKPPKYIALRRNEVKGVVSIDKVNSWRTAASEPEAFFADDMDDELGGRTQRQTMALRDVHYRMFAHMHFRNGENNVVTQDEQFERRAKHGKCFYQPYFGCREFPAFFLWRDGDDHELPPYRPYSADLGFMVYDTFDLGCDTDQFAKQKVSMFRAPVKEGVLEVPLYDSSDVLKPEDG